MSKVRKRGNTWQIDYFDPEGKRVRKSFKLKRTAEAELGKRVSLISEGRYLDVKKECNHKLSDLIRKYTENFNRQASFKNGKVHYLDNFSEYFGKDTLLSNIKYVDLESYQNHIRQKITKNKTVRTPASVNREMSCLHHLFSKADEWEMTERSPFDRKKPLKVKENNKRLRFLAEPEIGRLLDACPVYLRDIVECALNTGMRRGEILSLTWEQVRNGNIYLTETKTNESRQIPINSALDVLFKRIRQRNQLESKWVFLYEGRPVKEVKHAFQTALKRAGIQDFHFHDLRHTFASQVLLKGGDLKDIQELLGHKTLTMTLRYAHLTHERKRQAVNLLNGLTSRAPETELIAL